MSEAKTPEQIEQENYDNMLNAMAEYTMHKDSEQYDDDDDNDKTIDEYKKDLENAMNTLEQSETNEGGELIIDAEDYTEDELEALNAMNEYSSFHAKEQYEYVVRGALLHCSCGSHHRRLNLPRCHGVYRGGNPLMRSDDCKAGLEGSNINITSFGICSGPGSGDIGQGNISLAPEVLGEDGIPIAGETDGGVITGNRCMASFLSGTWENTHHETQITDEGKFALTTNSFLKCKYGGIIRVVTSGQETVIKDENISDMTQYELPEDAQAEIEGIVASDKDWETKSNEIRQVYEKSLYNYNDEVKAAFDAYSVAKASGNQEKLSEAESDLNKVIQETPIDIKALGRSLSEDVLRVVPQNNTNIADELITFAMLVAPNAPMDLKNQHISKATGDSNLGFSVWSLSWKDSENGNEIRGDYMGNYTFGYLGAGYFRNIDFDNYIIPISGSVGVGSTLITGSLEGGLTTATATGVTTKVTIEALRAANPDKTDAEIMCLTAGGVAQLGHNMWVDGLDLNKQVKNAEDYFKSLSEGSWGDNEGDSVFSSDGFNDYYTRNGLDKNRLIEEERTW